MHKEELLEKFNDIFSFNVTSCERLDAHSILITTLEFDGTELIFTWYNDHSFKLETK